jgi:hypothetical protein
MCAKTTMSTKKNEPDLSFFALLVSFANIVNDLRDTRQ